jgi:GNAT superfamily N-acetyltransferase
MASSDAVCIERLGPGDAPAGMDLSDAAGWNQSRDDWAFFMERGDVFGVRDAAGSVVATAAALPYDGGFGWISMVLVDAAQRHRGIASSLLDRCIAALRATNRVPVLDATPAGAEVYRRLGFVAGFSFDRWERAAGAASAAIASRREPDPGPVEARRGADVDDLVALDAAAHHVGRAALLRALIARSGTRAWLSGARDGFAIARAGRRATQVGPVVAARTADALALVEKALASAAGRVFIDVPARVTTLVQRLEQQGFVRQRSFVRMALSDAALLSADRRVFALAGPEFG